MPEISRTNIDWHLDRLSKLKSERGATETMWQEIADYCDPVRASYSTRQSPTTSPSRKCYDNTSIDASLDLAGNLHGLLTNLSTRWFDMRLAQDDLNEQQDAREWADETVNVILREVRDSNADSAFHEVYLDEVNLGTAGMFAAPRYDDKPGGNPWGEGLRFYARHMSELYLAENQWGLIDTVYRSFEMSARQAALQFGLDAVSLDTRRAAAEEPEKMVQIVHASFPRDDVIKGRLDNLNMPYASVYIEVEAKRPVREGGFEEWPWITPRWLKVPNEIYGRGPALAAMPAIRQLNRAKRSIIRAAEKRADPPLLLPDDGVLRPVRTKASGLNYYDAKRPDLKIEQLPTGDPAFGWELIQSEQEAVRKSFHVDLFDLKQSPAMTLGEAMIRDERQRRQLGPILGRHNSEFLRVLVERCFGILWRQGRIPEPPESIAGQKLLVEYTSPIAKAQRMHEAEGIQRGLALAAPLVQFTPEILDNIDTDEVVRSGAELYSVPAKILRSRDEVAAMRQKRAEQMQQAQQAQQMQQALDAGKTGADAMKSASQARLAQAQAQPPAEEVV